ncbi:MAG: TetR/AcrR family transcriptional regulator [Planctomycetota bacterium]|nr:MAG: TetR/AcrR family transcriptional regulator [Planctomycetota bacterium]
MSVSTRGARKRRQIVEAAAQLASHRGLKAASLSRIAERVGLTKSGLVAHFPSKEDLTLAVIDHAAAVFGREVLQGIDHSRPAIERLLVMLDRYRRYVIDETFEGGCLFLTMVVEIDDVSPREAERIRHYMNVWKQWIERVVRTGIERGELRADTAPAAVSDILIALCLGMGPTSRLFGAPEAAFDHAREAAHTVLATLRNPGTG